MHITLSDETVAMLQEVAIIVGSSSANAVGEAILKRECARILNLAKKQGVGLSSHEPHAHVNRQGMSIPQPQPAPAAVDTSNALSTALRKQAGQNLSTFENNLGPDAGSTAQLQQIPRIPEESREHTNFTYPGSSNPIRKVKI